MSLKTGDRVEIVSGSIFNGYGTITAFRNIDNDRIARVKTFDGITLICREDELTKIED
jgi:hypothetical protein